MGKYDLNLVKPLQSPSSLFDVGNFKECMTKVKFQIFDLVGG